MADARISCAGVQAGDIFLPSFQLRPGELVCLHLPRLISDGQEEELLRVLTGEQPIRGYVLCGRVLRATPAVDNRRGFLRLLRTPRATEWLRRQAPMSREEAQAVLPRIGLDGDWPISSLAGNPRILLGLEAAWAGGASAIIFQTAGCDPSGVHAVYTAVAARIARCPAIHLSSLTFQEGRPHRDCFPGGVCIQLGDAAGATRPAESA